MSLTIRVLLADDHALVRSGLRALLAGFKGVEVVAEAGSGKEALELVEEHRPHVVIMDIAMPELNGLDATERIKKRFSDVQVLLLSMYADDEYIAEAIRVGASGYVLKDAGDQELEMGLRAVAGGESYLSPPVARKVMSGISTASDEGPEGPNSLTPRQREVLQLIAEGHSTKSIARRLDLSVKTVENHRASLMERLGIHNVAGLVRHAIRMGLIRVD